MCHVICNIGISSGVKEPILNLGSSHGWRVMGMSSSGKSLKFGNGNTSIVCHVHTIVAINSRMTRLVADLALNTSIWIKGIPLLRSRTKDAIVRSTSFWLAKHATTTMATMTSGSLKTMSSRLKAMISPGLKTTPFMSSNEGSRSSINVEDMTHFLLTLCTEKQGFQSTIGDGIFSSLRKRHYAFIHRTNIIENDSH
ncbi:hypothetical protein C1H46_013558 [Malus baccata]|uniref:Uncharacterized protein n=1 Tax=Malus baccata TaxID=106549 RepID=A0A540MR95_MALBA|nr:hypothetical protein C1H46_013558 [Malus baccata]